MIRDDFGGEIPRTMEELLLVPAVARKTANIVLGNAYGIVEGIAVDTHVIRLSRLLGLTDHADAVTIERDLMQILPKKNGSRLPTGLLIMGESIARHGGMIMHHAR